MDGEPPRKGLPCPFGTGHLSSLLKNLPDEQPWHPTLRKEREGWDWSFYILSRLDTGKSGQYTMLSRLTTYGFVSGHDFQSCRKAPNRVGL